MRTWKQLAAIVASCCLALILTSSQAHCQFMSNNFKGDFGLLSGTQPDPGFYAAGVYVRYDGETLRDSNGESIALDPEETGQLDANGYALGFWWVTKFKLFGANYGFMIFPAFTDNTFEVPILALTARTPTGFTDLWVNPINLGWHLKQADIMAGLSVFVPTGRYDADADDNLGMGMWGFEAFAGTTLYFDEAKTWNFATTAFLETHTEKEGTDIRVGDVLTLEGGMGKSFLEGGLNVGLAYYAQWKLSHDDLGEYVEEIGGSELPHRHQVWGFGPEVTLAIATKSKVLGLVGARYLWETGAQSTLQGRTFALTITVPIPSISLTGEKPARGR